MSISISSNRLQNWNFLYGILRKLRLPIYDPSACPKCWCGQTHDCWGGHTIPCKENNKMIAHHFIRDGWEVALQRVIALAGCILPTVKLDTEKPSLLQCDPGTKPLDISFEIDPVPSPDAPPVCEYACVGGNITIISPVQSLPPPPEDVIETVMTAADVHLQVIERKKLMRSRKTDSVTGAKQEGDQAIGELIQKPIMM